jgi:hypothetical protein
MDEVIEEITRQIIYKALKIKILVEKGGYLPKNRRYFPIVEEPFLKMEGPNISWRSTCALENDV